MSTTKTPRDHLDDLSYRAVDDMFTAFYPNTPAGEDAWREMAAQNGGDGKVLSIHAADVARQLREKGYTVSAAAPSNVSSADEDALLAELAEANGGPKDADAHLKTNEERLDELRAIAEANGGKLLSNEWVGNQAAHQFTFADGREFEMLPSSLKNPRQGWPKDPDNLVKKTDANDGESTPPDASETRAAFSDDIFSAHKQKAAPAAPPSNLDERAKDFNDGSPENDDGHKGPRKPK